MWDLISAHQHLTSFLQKANVDAPRMASEIIISTALDMDRIKIYSHFDQPVSQEQLDRINELARRHRQGEPLQLVVGNAQFLSYTFEVAQGVLIPRPETEGLVAGTVERLKNSESDDNLKLLDIGTGTGVIAISLLKLIPGARATATDINPMAIELAQKNADALQVSDRLELLKGDMFDPLDTGEKYDLLISNPPYIPGEEISGLEANVREYDPHDALDGGSDGLRVIKRIVDGVPDVLRPGGLFALEVGQGQAKRVAAGLKNRGLVQIEIEQDLQGIDRCVYCRLTA